MPALANALTERSAAVDPDGKAGYEARRDAFLATLAPVRREDRRGPRRRFAGTPVTATEPVFGYMAEALGLKMRNEDFQTAIMNETEPAASDIAAMEDDIKNGRVKVLFYNAQVEDAVHRATSPTSPTRPACRSSASPRRSPTGMTFAEWMLDQLDATEKALGDTVFLSAIALDRVTLSVGGRTVLSDISLAIAEGEFVGVLGANGSGKTTLIKALLGLLRPDAGHDRGPRQAGRRAAIPPIGYLPQVRTRAAGRRPRRAAISSPPRSTATAWGLPFLSARGAARDRPGAGDRRRARRSPRGRSPTCRAASASACSSPQALIGKPRLLLLDEPLIGLDPHQQQVVVDLVRDLSRDLKLTVLFSAHELNQLLGAIDRVLYLGRGQAALGTVDEVITPGRAVAPLRRADRGRARRRPHLRHVARPGHRARPQPRPRPPARPHGHPHVGTTMLSYDFMVRAFAASGIVAIVAGTVGYFLVLRGQTFAGHALSHIGFAGATGAALIGVAPLDGVIALTVGAGAAMGLLGERLSGRDVAIGIVLSLSLGFGLLFLSLTTDQRDAGDGAPLRQRARGHPVDAPRRSSSSAS